MKTKTPVWSAAPIARLPPAAGFGKFRTMPELANLSDIRRELGDLSDKVRISQRADTIGYAATYSDGSSIVGVITSDDKFNAVACAHIISDAVASGP